jgi:hypothetical protein
MVFTVIKPPDLPSPADHVDARRRSVWGTPGCAALVGGKTKAQTVSFTLLSLPLYLAGQLDRLLRER